MLNHDARARRQTPPQPKQQRSLTLPVRDIIRRLGRRETERQRATKRRGLNSHPDQLRARMFVFSDQNRGARGYLLSGGGLDVKEAATRASSMERTDWAKVV